MQIKNMIVLIALLLLFNVAFAACDLNNDCDYNQFCDNSKCIALDCGNCRLPSYHDCIDKKGGICCNGYWNPKFSSCEMDYSFTESKIEGIADERTADFFKQGKNAVEIGWLEKAKYLFEGADLAATIKQSENDFNDSVHAIIDQNFEQALADIDNNRFISAKLAFSGIKVIQKTMRKPPSKNTPVVSDTSSAFPGLEPEEKPETPWVLIFILGVVLAVLFVVLLVFVKGKPNNGKKEETSAETMGMAQEIIEKSEEEPVTKWFD